VEQRRDVLVYTTAPLRKDVEVVGPVRVVLYAVTSARDTDFTAKLVDVFPDGRARNLTDGILRLRYRKSLEKPELARPGEICKLTIDAGVTGNVFQKGHRIRMEISSSNFPRFDRNPNTGEPVADATELRKAAQTIYHDARRPSYLLLPVLGIDFGPPGAVFFSYRPKRRGSQVVRPGSAKPLFVGSIPTRASNIVIEAIKKALCAIPGSGCLGDR
jgi:putative CocE/NonD family hydrolase